jgi:hypothetical protein
MTEAPKPETPGARSRRGTARRAPHPAQGARIAAAGFGTAATLTLVGVMAVAESETADPSSQSGTASVVVLPEQTQAAPSAAAGVPPVHLDVEPSTRAVVGGSPTPLRVSPDASTAGSR